MIIDTARRLWNSPTFTTWGSYATQSFNFIFVLPLLLTRFSTAEIAVWYLFKTVLDLQFVVDLGISVTFSRFIAYLMGTNERRDETLKKQIQLPNFENDDISLSQIWGTMNLAYLALSLSSAFIISIVITIMLRRPISFVENQNMVWSSWGIVVFTFFISLNGMKYSSFLQGINAIAEYRRYETLTNSGSILTSFIVLLSNGNILSLVLSQQAWKVINVLINRRLTKILRSDDAISIDSLNFNREIFSALWPASWRSGLGQFMSYGVTQISGLVYAQFGSADNIATYLLGLRLIQQVSTFSRAPFYSKLPTIFRFYSENKIKRLLETAKKGMSLSYWTYGFLFLSLAILAKPILQIIGSNAEFVPAGMWGLLGLGFLFERYGAHHIQLYSATNKIIWHIANGITGILFIITSIVAFPLLGVYSFPIGYIIGYAGFYSWYSAINSYKTFKMKFLKFEPYSLWIALMIVLAQFVFAYF